MSIAVVFPGQGSQAPGFGLPWFDHPASTILDLIDASADRPLRPLVSDPEHDLGSTRDAQLSVLLGSLLAWEAVRTVLDTTDHRPIAFAGHSLGQITALLAAGVVEPEDGLRLAIARAEASASAQQADPGTLIALLGADEAQARRVCDSVSSGAWIANLNGSGQIIVGTRPDSIDTLVAAAKEAGVRRTRRLDVDGAFHTPLMQPAADALLPTLRRTAFHTPSAPIITNHDAAPVTDADGWPERLHSHLIEPVRWEDVVHRLVALGADHIVEVGPGRTLTGLIRRIAPDLTTSSIATPDELADFADHLSDLAVGVPS